MSFLQHRADSTSQVLGVHPIELRLTQSTEQVVDSLIVGVEHVSLDPGARKFIGWT
jgi:hypothetical protein